MLSAAAEELLSSWEELRSRQRKLTLVGVSVLQSLQFCLLSLRVHLQLSASAATAASRRCCRLSASSSSAASRPVVEVEQ